MKHELKNGFAIEVENRQIGESLFCNYYSLYKNDLYVCSIEKTLLPDEGDENLLVFNVLDSCEERAYCFPHDIIREEDRRAVNAFKEYINDRKVVKSKSGWCTKTQFWQTETLEGTEEELSIIID